MSNPDIVVFYSLKQADTVINKVTFGSDINQTANGHIYSSET